MQDNENREEQGWGMQVIIYRRDMNVLWWEPFFLALRYHRHCVLDQI